MPHIRQLPAHLADLIAAGEVVERPASVCKELLENALDAGASAVSVELEKGGLTYLRVTDNGCGIAPQQLPTAFLRHATSKLRTADDLHAIGTLGFRGEALAAIAAVARVDIFSRPAEMDEGAKLHLEGGEAGEVTPAGCPVGTTIIVRDLFYNTPARMKFMKKDSAEGAAASAVVTQLALSHPEVSFRLLRDGAEVLHTPGNGQLKDAIYAALGRDFALSLLPTEGSNGAIALSGFVTAPSAGHGSRARQFFFVNGRLVKSQLLTAAVEEPYKNRLLKGKFPGCVLHLTLPTEQVDVNVHPAKTVVKFASEKAVFDAVYYTVKATLDSEGKPERAAEKPFYQTMTAQEFLRRSDVPKAAPTVDIPVGKAVGSAVPKAASAAAPTRPARTETTFYDVAPDPTKPFYAPTSQPGLMYRIVPPTAMEEPIDLAAYHGAAKTAPQETDAAPVSEVSAEPEQETEPVAEQTALALPDTPEGEMPWRIVGEVLKTYIICESDDGTVWLIDKHAAHERIRFDALKASLTPPMAQQLLSPLAVALDGEGYAAVLDNLPLLEKCGFVCENFGAGTVLVRSLPDDIDAADASATLEELAQKLLLHAADPDSVRDELLHTIACKSAIKAGMTNDRRELQALVERVQRGEIRYCPHGRPVAAKLTQYELEKMFKRA